MKLENTLAKQIPNGPYFVVDKAKHKLTITLPQFTKPIVQVNNVFDIIAVRDLLNDAYPPEVYSSANACKDKIQRGFK